MKILVTLIFLFNASLVLAKHQVSSKATTTAVLSTKSEAKTEMVEKKSEPESVFYSFVVKDADGKDISLSQYKGKYVLVVNVASKCGFTYQYEGLEKLYADLKDKGLVVLGFPSNQFLGQEPGTNAEIQKFCKLTYGVNFPVLAKVDVKGDNAIPLYKWLTSTPEFSGTISWNFNKFLLNRQGQIVKRYGSKDKPEQIQKDLKESFGF